MKSLLSLTGSRARPKRGSIAAGLCVDGCKRKPRPGRRPSVVRPLPSPAETTRLLRANWSQLEAIARRASRRCTATFDDLFQEACLAFIRCLSGYRPSKGPLEHYVARSALNAVLRHLTVFRGPISVEPASLNKHRRAAAGGVPEAEMSPTWVAAAQATNVMRLDARAGESGDMSMGDMLPAQGETPEEQASRKQIGERRRKAVLP